jgi:XTP/dITP diphosphohydrolase
MPHSPKRAEPNETPQGSQRRLVIASGNPGKLREFQALLAGLPFETVSQAALGVAPAEETGESFYDNALLKARHALTQTGCDALADDSGLEVDALGGAPGVRSARFAGVGCGDEANNARLLAALAAVPPARRGARYRCVLVLLRADDPRRPLVTEGIWEGMIVDQPRGGGGFGYDPYFFLPEIGCTAAELPPEEKNRRSHRGLAMRRLYALLAGGE